MKKLYRLKPTLHANIWGGNKLREYGKVSGEDRIGESWELSFVPGTKQQQTARRYATFSRKPYGALLAKNLKAFPSLRNL